MIYMSEIAREAQAAGFVTWVTTGKINRFDTRMIIAKLQDGVGRRAQRRYHPDGEIISEIVIKNSSRGRLSAAEESELRAFIAD
jgi:hypothetical protein